MLKKFLLSASVIIIFGLYAFRVHSGDDGNAQIATNPPLATLPPTSTPLAPTPTPQGTSSSTPPPPTATPRGRYKDGTYTGSVADAFYGNIQVQAVINGGKISNIIFLQYPNDRSTSREINSQAMPLLTQEAIAAQSAQVSGVSGATASSGAFVESLQNALQQAM